MPAPAAVDQRPRTRSVAGEQGRAPTPAAEQGHRAHSIRPPPSSIKRAGGSRPPAEGALAGGSSCGEGELLPTADPRASSAVRSAPMRNLRPRRACGGGEGYQKGVPPEVRPRWRGGVPEPARRGTGGEDRKGGRGTRGKRRERWKEKNANCYLHNQWQVSNFMTQKPVKAGGPGCTR